MVKILYGFVILALIPAILVALFLLSATTPSSAKTPQAKVSGRAGFWAGLVIFAVYVVTVAGSIENPEFALDRLPSFNWLGLIFGLVVGYALPFVTLRSMQSPLLGMFTLVISGASLIALFSYVFVTGIRDFMTYFALSALLGALLNTILNPDVMREIRQS